MRFAIIVAIIVILGILTMGKSRAELVKVDSALGYPIYVSTKHDIATCRLSNSGDCLLSDFGDGVSNRKTPKDYARMLGYRKVRQTITTADESGKEKYLVMEVSR